MEKERKRESFEVVVVTSKLYTLILVVSLLGRGDRVIGLLPLW